MKWKNIINIIRKNEVHFLEEYEEIGDEDFLMKAAKLYADPTLDKIVKFLVGKNIRSAGADSKSWDETIRFRGQAVGNQEILDELKRLTNKLDELRSQKEDTFDPYSPLNQ